MGTSTVQVSDVKDGEDHPHAYGDKIIKGFVSIKYFESSPRVWGQDSEAQNFVFSLRIIPTRMGTSSIISKSVPTSEDHPHAYGDKKRGII